MLSEPIFLNVHMYGIMVAIGILCAFVILLWILKKKQIEPKFIDFLFYNGLISIAVGFCFAALFQAIYDYISNPDAGFHFNGGLTFIGGLVGGVLCFLVIYCIFRNKYTTRLYEVISSEEDAIMLLTEANLINRDISFKERVIAYRQQYDVMKKKSGERSDLQADGEKIDSLDVLAKKYGESRIQMYRYLRTAELSDDLITFTGVKRIALDAAVKLTALNEDAQAVVANFLNETNYKINGKHADEIVKSYNVNSLNFTSLEDIFESEVKHHKPITSIETARFSKFFEGIRDTEVIEETIEKALEMYFEHLQEKTADEDDEDEYTQCGEIE